jgi:hypothetical protein
MTLANRRQNGVRAVVGAVAQAPRRQGGQNGFDGLAETLVISALGGRPISCSRLVSGRRSLAMQGRARQIAESPTFQPGRLVETPVLGPLD